MGASGGDTVAADRRRRLPATHAPPPEVVIAYVVPLVCALALAGMLTRAWGRPEWVWTTAGAGALVLFGAISFPAALAAAGKGTDVYLFLVGMMATAEVARREGVFDRIASGAVAAAAGSRMRLFALVYAAGTVVTVVLSNDATAVVLTPAVAAAVRRAEVAPRPYLFACAFIANAASFVLPISNPANLVVFADAMPTLPRWLATFALPSLCAVGATFVALALRSRGELRGEAARTSAGVPLTAGGRLALGGVVATATALVVASARGLPLGATTCACGMLVMLLATLRDRRTLGDVARGVSWSVLPLVAGLFVLVQALDGTGLLALVRAAAATATRLPPALSFSGAAALAALVSNAANNLPAGLLAGASVAHLRGGDGVRAALAIGVDLGPNLSVTGSLATVLWLSALRREGIEISAGTFLRTGALVMPPALLLATLSLLLTTR